MWLVLDKSKADQSAYDVLHIDRNPDGDLTGADERIAATKDEFRLGEFTDPATGAKHSDFHVRTTGNGPDVWLRLRWRGQFRFDGGYPTSQRAAICASLRNRPMRRWFGSTATPRSDSSASKAQN